MSLKEKIKEALGDEYTLFDELAIERIVIYYEIFRQTVADLKDDARDEKGTTYGYRRRVSGNVVPGVRESNARYFTNIAFTTMSECVKQIRAETEILGLSKRGKKLEVVNKIEQSMLSKINSIKDD
jgi:hypothetical protein